MCMSDFWAQERERERETDRERVPACVRACVSDHRSVCMRARVFVRKDSV